VSQLLILTSKLINDHFLAADTWKSSVGVETYFHYLPMAPGVMSRFMTLTDLIGKMAHDSLLFDRLSLF